MIIGKKDLLPDDWLGGKKPLNPKGAGGSESMGSERRLHEKEKHSLGWGGGGGYQGSRFWGGVATHMRR